MTRRTGNGEILTEDVLLINPEDAAKHGIAEGDMVCVESPRGKVDIKARITDEVKPGILSSTFHFPEMMLNLITSERERLTGDVPGVQGGELQDQEGEEDAFEGGWGSGGESGRAPSQSLGVRLSAASPHSSFLLACGLSASIRHAQLARTYALTPSIMGFNTSSI
jgi:hypothetical protein